VTTLTASDGVTLAIDDRKLPAPRARLVIVHGYAEHFGRYDEFVERLEPHDFECHRFDLRGHGHSAGVAGHVARFEEYLDDLRLFVEHVRALAGDDRPLFLIGHSLGGLIALEYIRRHRGAWRGLVVSSPFLRPGFEVPLVRRVLAAIASHVAPQLSLANPLEPSMVSNDAATVTAYANDPLVFRRTTPRWFTEVESAQEELCDHAAEVTLPLLMLLGGQDEIADHRLAAEVFERIGSEDKTLKQYATMRHEVFNETDRGVVYAELISWLQERAS
jgi:lysophospholipase